MWGKRKWLNDRGSPVIEKWAGGGWHKEKWNIMHKVKVTFQENIWVNVVSKHPGGGGGENTHKKWKLKAQKCMRKSMGKTAAVQGQSQPKNMQKRPCWEVSCLVEGGVGIGMFQLFSGLMDRFLSSPWGRGNFLIHSWGHTQWEMGWVGVEDHRIQPTTF